MKVRYGRGILSWQKQLWTLAWDGTKALGVTPEVLQCVGQGSNKKFSGE